MHFRKVLLRLMLWSLAIAAVVGAMAILFAAEEVIWRVVGTALTTAVASGLLMALSLLFEREKSRSAATLGITAVVVEFLLALSLIWEFNRLFVRSGRFVEATALTMLFILLTAVPAMFFLRVQHLEQGRLAAKAGLVLSAVVFVLLVVPAWFWNWTDDDKAWDSAGAIAAFGIAAVACLVGAGMDRRHWRHIGILASIVGLGIALVAIWWELREGSAVFTTIASIAGVIAYANLAMICPLMPNQQWVRWVAIVAAILTAVFIDIHAALPRTSDANLLLRSAGATGFIAACSSLAMLVLARINQGVGRRVVLAEIRELTVICPGCRKKQLLPVGEAECANCHLQFQIRITEPRCVGCGYLLYMLKSDRCPECGAAIRHRPAESGDDLADRTSL